MVVDPRCVVAWLASDSAAAVAIRGEDAGGNKQRPDPLTAELDQPANRGEVLRWRLLLVQLNDPTPAYPGRGIGSPA